MNEEGEILEGPENDAAPEFNDAPQEDNVPVIDEQDEVVHGELQMVGGAASFTAKARLALLADLEPLRIGDDVRDGEPSRWNSAADKRWMLNLRVDFIL